LGGVVLLAGGIEVDMICVVDRFCSGEYRWFLLGLVKGIFDCLLVVLMDVGIE
jgi:hypothetical protein